jgi:hypothetical protein
MGLTIARLAAETRTFTWKVLDEDVAVTYRPGVLTLAWDEQDVHVALAEALVSVDITNGKGKPIHTDAETLKQYLPVPFMRNLAKAIYQDSTLDPTTAETSAGS